MKVNDNKQELKKEFCEKDTTGDDYTKLKKYQIAIPPQ